MTLALGIDVGTSGVRTAVLAQDAVVSMARADHPGPRGDAIDATDWWTAVAACLDNQINALRAGGIDPQQISGIAVDGTSGTMVLTDADLNPVSPGLMYNSSGFDDEAALIARHVAGPHITRGANSALARAMRLVRVSRAAPVHLMHQADFIAAKLTGRGGQSDYNNALKTGFDPGAGTWPDWIGRVIDPDLLPQAHSPGTPLATVAPDVAVRFGMSPDTRVHAGTTDSIAAFLACAPLEDGVAVTSLGSTLAIKMLSAARIDDPDVGLYAHRLGDLWLVGGASNTGGAVLGAHFSQDDLIRLSRDIDPEMSTGLDYYPLLSAGERFPVNDPTLAPRMTPRPDRDTVFLQAMLEGMAAIEARCYDAIAARGGGRPTRIITAGGGARNEVWTRLRERALGLRPQRSDQTEAAVGAARLAQTHLA